MSERHSNLKAVPVTADGAISAAPCWYYGARIVGDKTNVATALLYDNGAASGTLVDQLNVAKDDTFGQPFETPVWCAIGLYADITTVGRLIVWIA